MPDEWTSGWNDDQGGADGAPGPVTAVAVPTVLVADAADPADPADPADGTSLEDEDAHRVAVDLVDALLDDVELALARLDDGTYGRCESCGSAIADAELADDPLGRACVPCGAAMAQPPVV
jgi:RNA polymerase-binding transcription factor DksA